MARFRHRTSGEQVVTPAGSREGVRLTADTAWEAVEQDSVGELTAGVLSAVLTVGTAIRPEVQVPDPDPDADLDPPDVDD